MRSTILYDWWLRDGMINTDRQVKVDWRRMMKRTVVVGYWFYKRTKMRGIGWTGEVPYQFNLN